MNKHLMAAALILSTAAIPAAASAQNYDYGHRYNGNYNGGSYGGSAQGTIGAVRGSNIQLTDGRNIFLHDGTVINPRGASLQPGQQIFVTGSRGGNGAINADQINVNGYGNGNNGGYGYGNNGWNRGGQGDRDDRWQRHRRQRDENDNNNNDNRDNRDNRDNH